MNKLVIKNLNKTYSNGVKAIDRVSLEISNGMFGLLGPNGAGKSSIMRTIAGLQTPDSGEIYFNGVNILKSPGHIKKQLGYLPQDFGVYPKASAYDLLEHLAILKGVLNKVQRKEQINALLQKTNLYEHRNKSVSTFSGGMRQRFGVAQCLLGDPKIIIVDEPTAGLDPEERNRFNDLLCDISGQIIIILSTHLVEDVRNLCPRMAIINKGKLLAEGSPEDFIKELDGKVWIKSLDKNSVQQYREKYQVIATKHSAGKQIITIYDDSDPGEGFLPKSIDLEDVYFTTLKQIELCSHTI